MPAAENLRAAIRDVVDFPKPGIVFKDITPILADGKLFRDSIALLCAMTGLIKPTQDEQTLLQVFAR